MTDKYTFRYAVEQFLHESSDYSGYNSDDHIWSKRALMQKFKQLRATLIKDLMYETDAFSAEMFQSLDCIEMIEIDQQLCPCAPASGCQWLRSKDPIPKPLVTRFVGSTMARTSFNYKSWENAKRIPDDRRLAARKAKYYTIREAGGGKIYLYVWNDKYSQRVTMSAIFEDPVEAEIFAQCGKETKQIKCFPLDSPMFLDMSYEERLTELAKAKLIPAKMQAPDDNVNNDRPDKQSMTKIN